MLRGLHLIFLGKVLQKGIDSPVAYAEGGSGGFSPQKIFGFSGLKTHGFLSFEAPYPMYFSMVDATSSDRTILLLPPVVIAQP